ncbi:hypothetical protein R3P38DRAFT_3291978 [Favolaschia claudopus]|uniref:EF-hand domain-containing protein n=1 Tax=Favolaschia claudopus TaxID=2862362 RepID=A0AAV9ZM73_9AGAR
MPMPKLLKKISRKNLRSPRSSDGSDVAEQDIPPLPSSNFDGLYGFPVAKSPSPIQLRVHRQQSSLTGSRSTEHLPIKRPSYGVIENLPARHPSHGAAADVPPLQRPRGFADRLPSKPASPVHSATPPSRNPSYTGSDYSRPYTSPSSHSGYYDTSPSPLQGTPNGYTRQRTTSHTPGHGGSYGNTNPPSPPIFASGDPHWHRGRSTFVPSPSQLSYSHVDETNPSKPIVPVIVGKSSPPGHAPSEDELSNNLADAWTIAITAPKTSKVDKVLQVIETNVAVASTKTGTADVVIHGIASGLSAVGGMDAIEQGINTFTHALDEVAKLHPFIGVAVMAFKAVWALEQKRRENDRRILALHLEMKRYDGRSPTNVKDADEVAPDGSTIKGRLQEIVNIATDDIKACANACDAYTKKKLVVKVLKGTFTKRRSEFEFALSVHTAVGVDAVNKVTQEMNQKMDKLLDMFASFVTPQQKEVLRIVEQKGGLQACQENDEVLRELSGLESKTTTSVGAGSMGKSTPQTSALDDLKDDLLIDPEVAISENKTAFSRKFEVQKRQIVYDLLEELTKVIEREGDRVISAVTAGPHDKIIDPKWYALLSHMNFLALILFQGLRGSVKSRHFVMALRDYYQEGTEDSDAAAAKRGADDWALEYLNVSRLQSISEAFDDDASGFITVAEANTFTAGRPLDWSLPHWIAMWAIGFHQASSMYAAKIRELIAKMFALRTRVLPANRAAVNTYLDTIYRDVTSLESALAPCFVNETLQAKFNSYVMAEEARLLANLEAVDYDLDALDTVPLITGPGRIERVLFIMYHTAAVEQDLEGTLVQELHPGMMINRKRADLVRDQRQNQFPHGTGIQGVFYEFNKDRLSTSHNDTSIHSLAPLALEAMWIMVETTFAVVHGKTNEWKLLVWLNNVISAQSLVESGAIEPLGMPSSLTGDYPFGGQIRESGQDLAKISPAMIAVRTKTTSVSPIQSATVLESAWLSKDSSTVLRSTGPVPASAFNVSDSVILPPNATARLSVAPAPVLIPLQNAVAPTPNPANLANSAPISSRDALCVAVVVNTQLRRQSALFVRYSSVASRMNFLPLGPSLLLCKVSTEASPFSTYSPSPHAPSSSRTISRTWTSAPRAFRPMNHTILSSLSHHDRFLMASHTYSVDLSTHHDYPYLPQYL